MAQKPGGDEDAEDEANGEDGALRLAVRALVQTVLAESDGLPEPDDGMWEPCWVTKKEVEQPTSEEGYQMVNCQIVK